MKNKDDSRLSLRTPFTVTSADTDMYYLKETLPDETIRLHYNPSAGNTYLFEGIHAENNTVAFRGKLVFQSDPTILPSLRDC